MNARVFVERLDNLLSCVEYLSKASPNAQPDMQFMKNFFDINDRKKMKEADHQTIVDVINYLYDEEHTITAEMKYEDIIHKVRDRFVLKQVKFNKWAGIFPRKIACWTRTKSLTQMVKLFERVGMYKFVGCTNRRAPNRAHQCELWFDIDQWKFIFAKIRNHGTYPGQCPSTFGEEGFLVPTWFNETRRSVKV